MTGKSVGSKDASLSIVSLSGIDFPSGQIFAGTVGIEIFQVQLRDEPTLDCHRTRRLFADCFLRGAAVLEGEVGGTARGVICASSSSTSPCFNFCFVSIA